MESTEHATIYKYPHWFLSLSIVTTLITGLVACYCYHINLIGWSLGFAFLAVISWSCVMVYFMPKEEKAWEDAREIERIRKELKAHGKDWKDIHVSDLN
jgi:hypothetical protein